MAKKLMIVFGLHQEPRFSSQIYDEKADENIVIEFRELGQTFPECVIGSSGIVVVFSSETERISKVGVVLQFAQDSRIQHVPILIICKFKQKEIEKDDQIGHAFPGFPCRTGIHQVVYCADGVNAVAEEVKWLLDHIRNNTGLNEDIEREIIHLQHTPKFRKLSVFHDVDKATTTADSDKSVSKEDDPIVGFSEVKTFTVGVFGLDGSGKSSFISAMGGEVDHFCMPTVGFSPTTFTHNNVKLTVYDLGGSAGFRGIWKEYYAELHAMLFVIDASPDNCRLLEANEVLKQMLSDHRALGKPFLMCANKQDLVDALKASVICDSLCFDGCGPFHAIECSATTEPIDARIEEGILWIITQLSSLRQSLLRRVEVDVEADKARRRQEIIERAKRVQRYKLEWEEEERLALASSN